MDSSNEQLDTELRAEHVVVIGNGHFGASLATHISRTAANTPYFSLSHTTRSSSELPITSAVSDADIIILAVPSSAYQSLIPDITPHLRHNVIIIDVANAPLSVFPCSRSHQFSSTAVLSKLLPPTVSVVKAFNTLSATLLTDLNHKLVPLPTNIVTPYAADLNHSVQRRMHAFITALGFTPYHLGPLNSSAAQMERLPHVFFPTYKSTAIVSTIIWIWWILYSVLGTYVIHGQQGTPSRPWDKFPLSSFMSTTGETCMTLFAITFLAGPFTLLYKKFARNVPSWMQMWLNRRKQLGLAAFVFAVAHGIAGAISASHFDDGWKGQLYFVPGIISFVMFGILAVHSSGHSATSLSWAEFRAVFSWLGTAALALGVLHQGLWGLVLHKHRPDPSYWMGGGVVMPISWVGIILPLLTLALRFTTWTPCFWADSKPSNVAIDGEVVDSPKQAV